VARCLMFADLFSCATYVGLHVGCWFVLFPFFFVASACIVSGLWRPWRVRAICLVAWRRRQAGNAHGGSIVAYALLSKAEIPSALKAQEALF